jgi:peptide/nickel transport system substrate-binding protein
MSSRHRHRHRYRYRATGLAAVGAVVALVAAACGGGGGGGSSGGSTSSSSKSGYNAAINSVINPSTHKGGTIVYDNSSAPDSTDPGNTYYAFNLNFTRLYATPLTTYQSCTGKCEAIVPALATTLGQASDGNRVWTYHLKPGVKFEDGTRSPRRT